MTLIRLLASLLGGRTWLAWLVVAVGLATAAGGAYAWIDHQGYARAEAKWSSKYEKREAEIAAARSAELKRQADANAAAKAREADAIRMMQAEIDNLERQLTDNATEAEADPNRDRPGLSAGAVERLNRIR